MNDSRWWDFPPFHAFLDGDEVRDRNGRRGRVWSSTRHFVFVRWYRPGLLICDVPSETVEPHTLEALEQVTG